MARGSVTNMADKRNQDQPQTGPDASILAAPDEKFLAKLRDTAEALKAIDDRRSALSSERTALLEVLVADHAINKAALLAAIRYCDLPEDKRENWDLTYQVTRKAMGAPVQMDLFEAQVEKSIKTAEAKKRIERARAPDPKQAAEAAFIN
jgi:hypothetical protein